MDKEWDEFTSCPICFEDYQERRDHFPRLLPCSHTLCEKCVRELMDGNNITCPQDRKTYQPDLEIHKFPQNNYILKQIRDGKERGFKKCENHGRDIDLFCRNEACQQELCSLCLTENHKMHDIVDLLLIKEAKLAEIAREIGKEKEKLENYGDKMNRARDEANEEFSKALTEVNTKKDELSVLWDERLVQIDHVFSTMTNIEETLSMENTYTEMSTSLTIIRKKTDDLTKMFKQPFPIFRFKPHGEDKCVGNSFETNHPYQRECPKVDQFTMTNEGIHSMKKERAQPESESFRDFLLSSRFLLILALWFACVAFMNFPKPEQRLLDSKTCSNHKDQNRLDHISSQAHIIQTDMQTCRNNIENNFQTLMFECFSAMFPSRIITQNIGDPSTLAILYSTQRSGDLSTEEMFMAKCITWERYCMLTGDDSGVSIGIIWDLDEHSDDPQQTKFTTTVECATKSWFCELHETSLYTTVNYYASFLFHLIHQNIMKEDDNIFIGTLQNITQSP